MLRRLFSLSALSLLLLVACGRLLGPSGAGVPGPIIPTSTRSALRSITVTAPSPTMSPQSMALSRVTETIESAEPVTSPSSTPTGTATPLSPTPSVSPTTVQTVTETPVPVTATISATSIISVTVAPTSSAQVIRTPDATTVNGIPVDEIVIMPQVVRDNVRSIFSRGQALGRNPRAFSKLGDSVTLTDHYLTRFDSGRYDLGPYAYLQPAIDHYAGSFARYGVATKIGLHAWSIFDPLWADKEWCLPDENIAACEIRLNNPSVLLIKIGSNDSGAGSYFEQNLRMLLDYAIENGVIPILGTKADRFEGPDDRNNRIMRQLAAEYAIPLWDYDRVAATLPRRGLSGDDVHMTMADADDYTNPETFERGYPVSDLTALMTLFEVVQEVQDAGDS